MTSRLSPNARQSDPPLLFVGLRHYETENTYRCSAEIFATGKWESLDLCGHSHHTEAAARKCGRAMVRKIMKENPGKYRS